MRVPLISRRVQNGISIKLNIFPRLPNLGRGKPDITNTNKAHKFFFKQVKQRIRTPLIKNTVIAITFLDGVYAGIYTQWVGSIFNVTPGCRVLKTTKSMTNSIELKFTKYKDASPHLSRPSHIFHACNT